MAAVWTVKQTAFVAKYASLCQQFLTLVDQIGLANDEFTQDTYGTGGANAITDTIVETILPAATAANFASAEGAMVTILVTVASNRGYLEIMRP